MIDNYYIDKIEGVVDKVYNQAVLTHYMPYITLVFYILIIIFGIILIIQNYNRNKNIEYMMFHETLREEGEGNLEIIKGKEEKIEMFPLITKVSIIVVSLYLIFLFLVYMTTM